MNTTATIEMKNVQKSINLNTPANVMFRIGSAITNSRMAAMLAVFVSAILGEKVSAARSLHLLNAITAAFCAFLFGGFSFLVQTLLLVWFGVAYWQCSKDEK